jgi:threonine dehydrogenase-like Zn-dependent dehydrogenase
MYGPGDVRAKRCDDARIVHPTDAVIRTVATCVCGSDLRRPYRGADPTTEPVKVLLKP